MLDFLFSLFKRKTTLAPRPRARQAGESVPGQPTGPAAGGSVPPAVASFICREPVLDRHEKVIGYRLFLSPHMQERLSGKVPNLRLAYEAGLISSLVTRADEQGLLGGRLAFIELSPGSLLHPQLPILLHDTTCVMVLPSKEIQTAPRALPDLGGEARLGCHLRHDDTEPSLLAASSVVSLSIPQLDGLEIADFARRLRRDSAHKFLMAADIDSRDDFEMCFRSGFDYFHGPYFARAVNHHAPRTQVDLNRVLRILGQLRAGASGTELATSICQDPVITLKLLRYINAAANGLTQHVVSIEQALLLVGRDRFYRWLSLLLFDVQKRSYVEQVLTEQALSRGRLLERLGQHCGLAASEQDELFLTGLFSLLDRLLAQPLADILQQADLPVAVRMALLQGHGRHAPLLTLAKAVEENDEAALEHHAQSSQLDAETVNREHIAALVWANELLSA